MNNVGNMTDNEFAPFLREVCTSNGDAILEYDPLWLRKNPPFVSEDLHEYIRPWALCPLGSVHNVLSGSLAGGGSCL